MHRLRNCKNEDYVKGLSPHKSCLRHLVSPPKYQNFNIDPQTSSNKTLSKPPV